MQQRAWVCCGKDKAFAHGVHALPTELQWREFTSNIEIVLLLHQQQFKLQQVINKYTA